MKTILRLAVTFAALGVLLTSNGGVGALSVDTSSSAGISSGGHVPTIDHTSTENPSQSNNDISTTEHECSHEDVTTGTILITEEKETTTITETSSVDHVNSTANVQASSENPNSRIDDISTTEHECSHEDEAETSSLDHLTSSTMEPPTSTTRSVTSVTSTTEHDCSHEHFDANDNTNLRAATSTISNHEETGTAETLNDRFTFKSFLKLLFGR